jgi:hypothetical protein
MPLKIQLEENSVKKSKDRTAIYRTRVRVLSMINPTKMGLSRRSTMEAAIAMIRLLVETFKAS